MHGNSPTDAATGLTRSFDVRMVAEDELSQATLDARQRRDANCFLDSGALLAWAHAFLPGHGWSGPLTLLSVSEDSRPSGFAAFAQQSIAGVRIAALAGYYWPFRTLALNADDPAAAAQADAVAELLSRRSPAAVLRLGPVSSDDRTVASLVAGLRARGWRALRNEGGPVLGLDLPGDVAQLDACASPSLLKNIAYLRRRLVKQHGEVRAVRHVLDADSVSTLATLERIEASSWVAGGDAKFIGAANRRFWTALAAGRGGACEVVFWLLYCGDEPVAFSAHFETPCVVYIVANSFDDRWKIHSPGSLLTFEVLRDAVTRGKSHVDWGQGDSGYKGRWGAKPSSTLFDVMLFKRGWVGSSLHAAARLRLRDWREPGG